MEFKCSSCGYTTPSRFSAERHLNKQKKCGKNPSILEVPVEIICEYCNKTYKTREILVKHLKICKVKKSNIEEECKQLKKQLEEANRKIINIINSNNSNSNNSYSNNLNSNNTYITINLTPYNDPNMEGMEKYLETAIKKTFLSVPTLIESVHFNKEYPENQNICITNKRTKDAKVFDGKKWKTINKDLLINVFYKMYIHKLNIQIPFI
jgi:hypothetical protein